MLDICVCIASIGRSELRNLLDHLSRCELREGWKVSVKVADDSSDGRAMRAVQAGGWALPIQVLSVGSGNISRARNAALKSAEGDYVAFLDDDEWPAKDWLLRMIATAETFDADVVIGPVKSILPEQAGAWLRAAGPLDRSPGATGERLDTGITGNSLMKLATLRRLGIEFDEKFGQTGGEDTDFFSRLAAAGARIVACEDAFVFEKVPMERLAPDKLRKRYMRGGYSHARAMLTRAGIATRASFYARSTVKLFLATSASVSLLPIRRDLSMRFAAKSWAAQGELLYGAGRPSPRPY